MNALTNLVYEYLNKLPLNKVMLSINFKALFGHYLTGIFQIKGLDMVTRGLEQLVLTIQCYCNFLWYFIEFKTQITDLQHLQDHIWAEVTEITLPVLQSMFFTAAETCITERYQHTGVHVKSNVCVLLSCGHCC
jgi:hypothetical protein